MKKVIGITLIAALCLCACSKEETGAGGKDGEDSHVLTVTYTIPDAMTGTRADAPTYVESAGNESVVSQLHLLFFHQDDHGNGSWVATTAANLKDASLKENQISFTPPTEVESTKDYDVLVVANLTKYTGTDALTNEYLATFQYKSYARTRGELQALLPVTQIASHSVYTLPDGHLLMSGTTLKRAGKDELSVDLLRAAVRIDIKCTAATAILSHAELRNVAPVVPFFRTQGVVSLPRAGSAQLEVTDNALKGGLYAIETRIDVTDPRQLLSHATCVLVNVTDPTIHTSGDSKKTWYRVDLNVDSDKIQYLQRNNAYTVVINAVNGPGSLTPDGAYNSQRTMLIDAVTIPKAWKASGVTPPDVAIS